MCRFFKDSQDSAKVAKRAEIVKIVEDYDDIQAENLLELVRSSKGNYIVFIDSDLEIDWETTDHLMVSTKTIRSPSNGIISCSG